MDTRETMFEEKLSTDKFVWFHLNVENSAARTGQGFFVAAAMGASSGFPYWLLKKSDQGKIAYTDGNYSFIKGFGKPTSKVRSIEALIQSSNAPKKMLQVQTKSSLGIIPEGGMTPKSTMDLPTSPISTLEPPLSPVSSIHSSRASSSDSDTPRMVVAYSSADSSDDPLSSPSRKRLNTKMSSQSEKLKYVQGPEAETFEAIVRAAPAVEDKKAKRFIKNVITPRENNECKFVVVLTPAGKPEFRVGNSAFHHTLLATGHPVIAAGQLSVDAKGMFTSGSNHAGAANPVSSEISSLDGRIFFRSKAEIKESKPLSEDLNKKIKEAWFNALCAAGFPSSVPMKWLTAPPTYYLTKKNIEDKLYDFTPLGRADEEIKALLEYINELGNSLEKKAKENPILFADIYNHWLKQYQVHYNATKKEYDKKSDIHLISEREKILPELENMKQNLQSLYRSIYSFSESLSSEARNVLSQDIRYLNERITPYKIREREPVLSQRRKVATLDEIPPDIKMTFDDDKNVRNAIKRAVEKTEKTNLPSVSFFSAQPKSSTVPETQQRTTLTLPPLKLTSHAAKFPYHPSGSEVKRVPTSKPKPKI